MCVDCIYDVKCILIPLSLVIPQKGQGLASLTPKPQPILELQTKPNQTIKSIRIYSAEGDTMSQILSRTSFCDKARSGFLLSAEMFYVVKFWVQGLSMTRSQQLEAVVCVTLATVVIEILVARNGK